MNWIHHDCVSTTWKSVDRIQWYLQDPDNTIMTVVRPHAVLWHCWNLCWRQYNLRPHGPLSPRGHFTTLPWQLQLVLRLSQPNVLKPYILQGLINKHIFQFDTLTIKRQSRSTPREQISVEPSFRSVKQSDLRLANYSLCHILHILKSSCSPVSDEFKGISQNIPDRPLCISNFS